MLISVDKNGKIQIPKEILQKLHIKTGDSVIVGIDSDRILIKKKNN